MTSPMRPSSSSTVTSCEKSPANKTFECSEENSNVQVPHTSGSVPQVQQCSSSDFRINEQATFLNDFPPECFGKLCI